MSEKMERLGHAAFSVVESLAALPTTTGAAAKVAINARASLYQLASAPALRRVPRRIAAAAERFSFRAEL